ncbi:NYN domain-containing protein [Sphingobacterium faecium]|uniref:NYN domain-containing protein n=1 Tax=Sphingobacterium faecium TaxID=34087 RepID=UPI001290FBF4|nr:NYN domain-containing protein [Sphingobacterium faecium]MQP26918.1 NYN domain-containing protein [Sphingobacterium faecium]
MPEETEKKIAILIDADNISYKKIEEILNEVKRYGIPTIKRIYGDWTSPYVENWKDSLLTHAITPIQQYSYTQGKNSTDSALIIDAMDILHSDRVDGFCIVSSDSDFTRLATRLRESGKLVIGIGERKTPKPFISSCDKFIYVEILEKEVSKKAVKKKNNNSSSTPNPVVDRNQISALDEETLELLKDTVDDTADESGWAFLGEIGSLFNKRKPDFDARNYGYEKISHLFKAYKEDFEIEERNTEKSRIKNYYIRNIINKPVQTNPALTTTGSTTNSQTTPINSTSHHSKPNTTASQAANSATQQAKSITQSVSAPTERNNITPKQGKSKGKPKNTNPTVTISETNTANQQAKVIPATESADTERSNTNSNQTKHHPPSQSEHTATTSLNSATSSLSKVKTHITELEHAIIPSKGNQITAEDVTKNQIRITKDLKPLFPNKTKKIRILIKNEYECAFSYRRDRSHVLSLGQHAAEELELEAGTSVKLVKLGDNSYQLEKISKESN